jgi:vacuolar protein sorting-associated protein 13A/C
MERRFRPPRIFGENNLLIPYDFPLAMGSDIIRKYKLKQIDYEKILFFDEIFFNPEKKNS